MKTTKKTIDIIISIIAACLLWAYVLNIVNPKTSITVREVPVDLQQVEALADSKLAIAGDAFYTVDVVLTGPRAEISNFDKNTLIATADLSKVGVGQNYVTVNVTCTNNLVTVDEVRSQKIQVYVDELVEIEKPLNVVYGNLDGDYEISVFSVETENVVVSGAKVLVDRVAEVRVDVDSSILETDRYIKEKLTGYPLDSEGSIVNAVKLSSEEIGVTLTRLAVKEIPFNVKTVGTPGLNGSVSGIDCPKTIKVKGTAPALAGLTSVTADPINIEGITANKSVTLTYSLPAGIKLSDTQEEMHATVKLADMASVVYEYDINNIVFLNLAEGLNVRIISEQDEQGNLLSAETIKVSVSGKLESVKAISASSVAPALDFSSIQAGQLKLEVGTVYTRNDLSISVDPTYIQVEVSAIEEPEEPGEEVIESEETE